MVHYNFTYQIMVASWSSGSSGPVLTTHRWMDRIRHVLTFLYKSPYKNGATRLSVSPRPLGCSNHCGTPQILPIEYSFKFIPNHICLCSVNWHRQLQLGRDENTGPRLAASVPLNSRSRFTVCVCVASTASYSRLSFSCQLP